MSHGPQPPPRTGPPYPHGGGYGQPNGPAGAQYSQAQAPAAYPGGTPRKKSKRGAVIAVVAVVLAAAAGGGAWWWLGGGADEAADGGFAEKADTQLSTLLEERYPDDWKPDVSETHMTLGSHLDGRWLTEQHLVREMWNEVVAYDLADGSVAWRVPVPGNGACSASRDASPDGFVAIMRGEPIGATGPKPCDQLTLVDINAGKEVWTIKLEPDGANKHTVANRPVVWGEYVFVATESGGFRYGIADGAPAGRGSGSCVGNDYATSGDTLMIWEKCPDGWVLVGYGPDLTMRWLWKYPEEDARLAVLSADPLIVVVTSRSNHGQQVWRVEPGSPDDPGEHTVLVRMEQRSLAPKPPCASTGEKVSILAECTEAVVGDGVLYLEYALDENYRKKGIMALDLESGEERWRAEAGGELTLEPVSVDEDGRLIAFQSQSPDGDARAAVVAIDSGTGNITPVAGLPSGQESGLTGLLANTSLTGDIMWRDGIFVIATPGVVVADPGMGGGPGSPATVIYS